MDISADVGGWPSGLRILRWEAGSAGEDSTGQTEPEGKGIADYIRTAGHREWCSDPKRQGTEKEVVEDGVDSRG